MTYEQKRTEFSQGVDALLRDGAELSTRLRKHAVRMLCERWYEYGVDLNEKQYKYDLERLADYIMEQALSSKNKHRDEYPVFTEDQLAHNARRHKTTLSLSEIEVIYYPDDDFPINRNNNLVRKSGGKRVYEAAHPQYVEACERLEQKQSAERRAVRTEKQKQGKQRKKDERRRRVEEAIRSNPGATRQEIAQAAGVGVATVYRYLRGA